MALAVDVPLPAAPARSLPRTGAFAVPALASLGAGAIHASAIGAHNEHRQAVVTFAVVAAVQLSLAAWALVSGRRLVGVALALANTMLVAGWALAKGRGISFVDGLDETEPVQWADGLAAALAVATVLGVAVAGVRRWAFPASSAVARLAALPMAGLAVTGMVAAGGHAHAGTHGEAVAEHHAAGGEKGAAQAVVVPPRPFVPGQPIDLGGVEGVTAAQQAEAELVLASTLYHLPHWADFEVAEAEGWSSIGDGVTGYEHFVNRATFDDGKILDPTAPESLVYRRHPATGARTLVAAMFMLPPGTTLADVPDTGGRLMQWHIHDNLCFNADAKVVGLRAPGAPCPAGQFVGGENPMIHVWITSHPCGPFAALEGVAGGSIAPSETRLCDRAHGA